MEPKWTHEQQQAIDVKDRAAVVSAAAGSGKTAVLIEKLLRLLTRKEDPVPADRIVVVTFTNDAADQMKQRLTEALSIAAAEDPDNELLLTQQALIPSAKISTIHSFCFGLIRENGALAGIEPSFRVLDSAEDDVIAAKAASLTLDRWFEERNADAGRLMGFFANGAKSEQPLLDILHGLRKRLLALPFPECFMDDGVKRYSDPFSPEGMKLISAYAEKAEYSIQKALRLHTDCLETIRKEYEPYNNGSVKVITNALEGLKAENDRIREYAAKVSEDPLALFSGRGVSFERVVLKGSIGKNGEVTFDEELLEYARKLRTEAKDALNKVTGRFTVEDIQADFQVHSDLCGLLFELIKDSFREEARLKSEKNALGFSDAEQIACSLLCEREDSGEIHKTALARELSEYYSIVMIDEFQDSTAVQELIFRMISKNGGADRAGTDMFAVGDVKQSIYRFRCADPSIFIRNIENSVPYEDDGSAEPCHILLNSNFRSSQSVVSFVNTVFDSIMSKKCGGIDYGEKDRLKKGSDIGDEFGDTELILLPSFKEENGEPDSSLVTEAEAKAAAARIKEMLSGGAIREADGSERQIKPSDFCILLRSGKDKTDIYIRALEALGISAEGPAEESFLGSREISVLINLLRSIDNPTLDIPLTAVLMSPMFMFTAEDMARIRLEDGTSVYARVCRAAEKDSSSPEALRKQCSGFVKVFGALREYSAAHSIEKLIGYIYDRTDYMSVISVYKDSAKKKANLRLLPLYAADYDKNGAGGLGGFIRRIDSMAATGRDFEAASSVISKGNSVTVTTIHKSKGLEYPFVFLCDTWKKFNDKDLNKSVLFSSDWGAAFKICDRARLTLYDSFPRSAVSAMLERSLRDEEMMLLYVALTRAKHKLFITWRTDGKYEAERMKIISMTDPSCPKQDFAVKEAKSMSGWLDAALGLFEKDGNILKKGNCRVVLTEAAEAEETEISQACGASPDEKQAEKFRENMKENYDLTLSETAAKLTVTEIAKDHSHMLNRVFSKEERTPHMPKGISAAAAGTAVHAFMQYADIKLLFEAKPEDRDALIGKETDRLRLSGLISDLEAECADKDRICAFLDSDICRRMMKSEKIYREKKFLVKISDLNLDDSTLMIYNNTEGMLQGVADCVFEEDDGYVLIDYKTDRRVTDDILRQRYSKQLSLYAAALSHILEKPVKEGYLYSFDMGASVKTEI